MNRLVWCCLLASIYAHAQPAVPAQLRNIGIDQKLGTLLPLDTIVSDEAGKEGPIGRYFGGRPVVLAFVYYRCPMLCDVVLNGMVRSFRAMTPSAGAEFEVVTLSFDPGDTPAVASAKKANYLAKYRRPSAASGWHFLTANASAINRLAAAAGFRYAYDAETKQFVHASGILVLTPDGHMSRYFYGVEYPPEDLRLALVESGRFRVASRVEQLLLYCFHYNPASGKYGLLIMRTLRGAGILTVLALICGLPFLNRRTNVKAGSVL